MPNSPHSIVRSGLRRYWAFMNDFLEARSVKKRYGGIVALSDGNLSARTGEVHGLLGENGAGKSTLIQILAGAVRADDGAISLGGQPLAFKNPVEAQNSGISVVFQELSLIPDLTVEAKHLVPPRAAHRGANGEARRAQADDARPVRSL